MDQHFAINLILFLSIVGLFLNPLSVYFLITVRFGRRRPRNEKPRAKNPDRTQTKLEL